MKILNYIDEKNTLDRDEMKKITAGSKSPKEDTCTLYCDGYNLVCTAPSCHVTSYNILNCNGGRFGC
jgi:hypothetical protein